MGMLGRERSTWLPVRRRLLTVALGLAVILVGVATPAASAQFLFGFNEGRVFGAGNVYLGDAVANREAQVSSRVQRFFVEWSDVEPNAPRGGSHTYDWSSTGYDRLAASLRGQGIRPLIGLLAAPPWAHGPLDGIGPGTPPDGSHLDDFAAFAAAFAARYRGRVRYYVIWNEPNLSAEWGARPPDPVAYTALLRTTYPAVKAADPAAVVLLAGLAPTLEPAGSPWGLRDTTFLEGVYAAGGQASFDGLAAHAYGLQAPPDDPAAPDRLNFARVAILHDLLARHGDGAKPVLVTEAGWNDSPRWVLAVRPAQRIAYTLGAYEKARRDWPWCLAVTIWAFRYPKPAYTYFDNYTFVTPDFQPKPIYAEVQRYARP